MLKCEPIFASQAYGAVAPARRSSGKRIKAILSAAAIAMAVTALILVATQDSNVSEFRFFVHH